MGDWYNIVWLANEACIEGSSESVGVLVSLGGNGKGQGLFVGAFRDECL